MALISQMWVNKMNELIERLVTKHALAFMFVFGFFTAMMVNGVRNHYLIKSHTLEIVKIGEMHNRAIGRLRTQLGDRIDELKDMIAEEQKMKPIIIGEVRND